MSYSKRGEGVFKIMCFIGEMIKFQKLLKIQQDKDRKLTLEIDQMELLRDLDKKILMEC